MIISKRRFIVGDIHSELDILKDVLEKAGFKPDEDILYSTGDFCDRGKKPVETLEFLMGIPDFRPVLGNHDDYLESYLFTGKADPAWLNPRNGGQETFDALSKLTPDERRTIRDWVAGIPVVRVEKGIILVHGGIPEDTTEQDIKDIASRRRLHPASADYGLEEFFWDRTYLTSAIPSEGAHTTAYSYFDFTYPLKTRKRIYIGHTPLKGKRPVVSKEYHLVAVDTGAGGGRGPITLMNIDTGEYWQSGPMAAEGKQEITLP